MSELPFAVRTRMDETGKLWCGRQRRSVLPWCERARE